MKLVRSYPGVCGGRPVVSGTRVRTALVAEMYLAGIPVRELTGQYGLTVAQVRAALEHEGIALPEELMDLLDGYDAQDMRRRLRGWRADPPRGRERL